MKDVEMTGIYMVYDKVADKPGPLFEAVNDGVSVRMYRKLLGQHEIDASDYVLRRVGDRLSDGLIKGYLFPVDVMIEINLNKRED